MQSDPYHIMGHDIYFPDNKSPFSAQLAVISKALTALSKGKNALLESPTGTGKTLALLTSTLSWRKREHELIKETDLPIVQHVAPSPCTASTPENFSRNVKNECGSCSVLSSPLQTTPSKEKVNPLKPESEISTPSLSEANEGVRSGKKRSTFSKKPRIFFCSRTHSQLHQAVNELKACHSSYTSDLTMCVLGSRSRLCVNKYVLEASRSGGTLRGDLVDEECRKFQVDMPCPFTRDLTNTLSALAELRVWDIEDAVALGKQNRGCPYFSSQSVFPNADIVFAPYAYLIEPTIRAACRIDLKDAVVVFDEAHNIEDVCRSAASLEVTISTLSLVAGQLRVGTSSTEHSSAYNGLLTLITGLMSWMKRTYGLLQDVGFEQEQNVWDGREALDILEHEVGLTWDALAVYKEFYEAVRGEEDEHRLAMLQGEEQKRTSHLDITYDHTGTDSGNTDEQKPVLTAQSKGVLAQLLVVFDFMLRDSCVHIEAYRMVIERSEDGRMGRNGKGQEISLNFWCLSASVAFKHLADNCWSVILTSGTLSPLDSFESELDVQFPVRVEASHVIDTQAQVYVAAVGSCGGTSLDCTFLNQSNFDFQDSVGNAVLALGRVTDGGILVFLPSYSLLDKLVGRWTSTGYMSEFSRCLDDTGRNTSVHVEPRDGSTLDKMLKQYYSAIDSGGRAILFAVCRGKVSEGIDFADNYARTVVIVGIPYPSLASLEVKLKRQFMDNKRQKETAKVSLNGEQWYSQQAYRAVNQAVGRCIRHIRDFGAVVLCDPRFRIQSNQRHLSRWMRNVVADHTCVEEILTPLKIFFNLNTKKFADHLQYIQEQTERRLLDCKNGIMTARKGRKGTRKKKSEKESSDATAKQSQQPTISELFSKCLQKSNTADPTESSSETDTCYPNCVTASACDSHSVVGSLVSGNRFFAEFMLEIMQQWKWSKGSSTTGWGVVGLSSVVSVEPILSQMSYIEDKLCKHSGGEPSLVVVVEEWMWPAGAESSLTFFTEQCYRFVLEDTWVPADGIVYRLLVLYYQANAILTVAAKIIAADKDNIQYLDTCFVNYQLVKSLASFQSKTISPQVRSPAEKPGCANSAQEISASFQELSTTVQNDHSGVEYSRVDRNSCIVDTLDECRTSDKQGDSDDDFIDYPSAMESRFYSSRKYRKRTLTGKLK